LIMDLTCAVRLPHDLGSIIISAPAFGSPTNARVTFCVRYATHREK
jgi:hypothetical protein